MLVVAGVLAYANALSGPFLFDDLDAIVDNPHVRSLWPLSHALSAPPQATVAGRPVVSLSLALNHSVGGLDVVGYHAFNLVVHLACGLLLYGVVRRTMRRPAVGTRLGEAATGIGWVSACLWLVHPLCTEAVNYVVQRTELLMALFYLGTLYCAIRADDASARRAWSLGAVAACALGMASKESMVTAPLMVVAWDLAFGSDSRRSILVRRAPLYAGLAAGWVVLAALMASGPRSETVGTSLGVGPLDYLRSQSVVVVDYLRHAFWPRGLVFDYGYARSGGEDAAIGPFVLLALLLIATGVAWYRRPALGFAGIWVFGILAPTSSLLPIVSEVGAERRMYLPLAGLLTLVVVAAYSALSAAAARRGPRRVDRPALALALVAVVGLGLTTRGRNEDYRSDLAIWQSALAATPFNPRAHGNLGRALHVRGRTEEAIEHYRLALALDEHYSGAHYNLGVALAGLGRRDEAVERYRRALELNPGLARTHNNLGSELANRGELSEALEHFREAVRLAPHLPRAQHNLGRALKLTAAADEAVVHLREAVRLDPDWPEPMGDLAWILATHPSAELRDPEAAVYLARRACELTGNGSEVLLDTLGAAYAAAGRFDEAMVQAAAALELASRRGNADLARDVEQRLNDYRRGASLREP